MLALPPPVLLAQLEEERELEAVRERIGALEQRLERQAAERSEAAGGLRRAEIEIGAVRQALDELAARTAAAEGRARELAAERAAADERLAAEREMLAEQLRVTFINGGEELVKLLLSQESPADFGRMMIYYDYFNRARGERIGRVVDELEALMRLETEAAEVAAELETLAASRASELASLEQLRAERETLLVELERSIEADGNELEELAREEVELASLVTELNALLADFPVESEEPFPRVKGLLPWPVTGEIVGDYGDPRGGGVRRNGVLIASPLGTPVRAVYHGRVVFAEYLPALGMLIVLDHGDGYMTLYGHNEALLKEPGDWVRPGDQIALVGASGGRQQSSLHFEIRHQGEPVDPHAWIAN